MTPKKLSDYELAVEKHKYVVEVGGEPQVNITTISDLLDINGKSSAFAAKAHKLAKAGGQTWFEYVKESKERGTRVHSYLESYVLGTTIEARTDELGYVDALEGFLNTHKPKLLAAEFVVVNSDQGYGGRGDLLVIINGENWIIDLKTGKHFAIPHTLQLAALRYADRACYNEAGMLTAVTPMPEVQHTADLYVRNNGTFDLIECPADKMAYKAFCSLLWAYAWTESPEMKRLTKAGKDADVVKK